MNIVHRSPTTLTILPTYRCNAACENCCFDSHPGVRGHIPTEKILSYIDEAVQFRSIRSVVISGGEPFLIGEDLDVVIKHAKFYSLNTRIVTNGYWASSLKQANSRLIHLATNGLDELNLSTGDYHIKFVPFERVIFAAHAAVSLGMRVAIMVEGRADRMLTMKDVECHELLSNLVSEPMITRRPSPSCSFPRHQ